ncbi:MAG: chalcone isomerase family protein, partial [Candidatus Thiodiazotropha sp. 6PLUC5]
QASLSQSVTYNHTFPGRGTRVRIKGDEKATIPGDDFFQGLLKIWIGSDPVTKSLKRDMLGQ